MDNLVFRYPVYMPYQSAIDTVRDWGMNCLHACHDAAYVLEQPYSVAALPVFFDRPGHWAFNAEACEIDLSKFDLVLFSDPEYASLQEIREWLPVKNYLLAYGGYRSDELPDTNREVYRAYYIRDFFDHNEFQDTHAEHKPFLFDVLLGSRRAHRDFVMQSLDRSGLLGQTITTYRSGFPGTVIDNLTHDVQNFFRCPLKYPYVSENLDSSWEVAATVKNQHSRISPVEIYRRCWYSIICETLHTGDHFFLSEKTIKTMFNRRVFVLFGPKNYIKNLRRHGFQSFDLLFDETYDSEARDLKRWQQAMHSVWQLSWFERPDLIYQDYSWLLDHNQLHLKSLELKRCVDLYELLHRHIPIQHWYSA